jgi:hypothetical protein
VVIYMGLKHARVIAEEMLRAGRPAEEPVALVAEATTPRQTVVETTLAGLPEAAAAMWPPAIICVGRTVLMRRGSRLAGPDAGRGAARPRSVGEPGAHRGGLSARPPDLGARLGLGQDGVTLGMLRALRRRACPSRSAKAGPDYIDPRFHEAATGASCVNLDAWAMGEGRLRSLAGGAGLLVVEGAMGLFDGASPDGRGSSAHLARVLALPGGAGGGRLAHGAVRGCPRGGLRAPRP